jgi:cytochrome bd ubiquinol oxidase subunit II
MRLVYCTSSSRIVLRGCGFVFQKYGDVRQWGRTFAVATAITPLLFGICVGAVALQAAIAVAGITTLVALWREWWRAARAAAAAQVSFILWGWAVVQYPYLVPFTFTIRDAAAPRSTLQVLLGCLAAGSLVLIPSLAYLFRAFSSCGAARARGVNG